MITVALGTRAELIKTFPVIKELEKRGIEYEFIATGQHNLDKLCDLFEIERPKYLTEPPKEGQKFVLSISRGIKESFKIKKLMRKYIIEKKPDAVVVHGDTASTASIALSSLKTNTKLAHIEAGLRSRDLFEPFPEEFSRILTDHLSQLLFAVSRTAYKNLKMENVKGKVYLTGNTIVDSALKAYEMGKKEVSIPDYDYGVVTVHRLENLKLYWRMLRIVRIISETSKRIKLLFFAHENTLKALNRYNLLRYIEKNPNIELCRVRDYPSFIVLLKNSKIILTDGGSMQEESLVFGIPAIILRMRTERVDGLKTGINYLSKLQVREAIRVVDKFLSLEQIPEYKNPYGKPGVSKKIAKILIKEAR